MPGAQDRPSNDHVVLGHVVAAHGIRGDVIVRAHTADPKDLMAYGPLSDGSGRPLTIKSMQMTGKGLIIRFAGIDDRTAAEAMRGTPLSVARSALPPPDEGEYYLVDLVGLTAVDEAGQTIGTVIAVENFGAGTMLEIRQIGSSETEYVPFTDAFVPTVDVAAQRIVVRWPAADSDHD